MPREIDDRALSAAEQAVGREQLMKGALNIIDGTVIAVASTAPAYSLTATVTILAAAVGLWSPAAMVVAFFPMLGVAVGFYWLNRQIPDCGTSYAWISKALHPSLGFFTGWVIVAADVIVMISLAGVAASSTETLFGLTTTSQLLNFVIGTLWIAGLTWVVVRGIEISAKMQWGLLAAEYVIVMGFSLWAVIDVYANHPAGSHVFRMELAAAMAGAWRGRGAPACPPGGGLSLLGLGFGWERQRGDRRRRLRARTGHGLQHLHPFADLRVRYRGHRHVSPGSYRRQHQQRRHPDNALPAHRWRQQVVVPHGSGGCVLGGLVNSDHHSAHRPSHVFHGPRPYYSQVLRLGTSQVPHALVLDPGHGSHFRHCLRRLGLRLRWSRGRQSPTPCWPSAFRSRSTMASPASRPPGTTAIC